jgi:hypothetical protein
MRITGPGGGVSNMGWGLEDVLEAFFVGTLLSLRATEPLFGRD